MNKNLLFYIIMACICSVLNIDAAITEINTPKSGQAVDKQAQIKEIDLEIQQWQVLEKKYKMDDYVESDDASRHMEQDWMQYREDVQKEEQDEQILRFIQQQIDKLQKKKEALQNS